MQVEHRARWNSKSNWQSTPSSRKDHRTCTRLFTCGRTASWLKDHRMCARLSCGHPHGGLGAPLIIELVLPICAANLLVTLWITASACGYVDNLQSTCSSAQGSALLPSMLSGLLLLWSLHPAEVLPPFLRCDTVLLVSHRGSVSLIGVSRGRDYPFSQHAVKLRDTLKVYPRLLIVTYSYSLEVVLPLGVGPPSESMT